MRARIALGFQRRSLSKITENYRKLFYQSTDYTNYTDFPFCQQLKTITNNYLISSSKITKNYRKLFYQSTDYTNYTDFPFCQQFKTITNNYLISSSKITKNEGKLLSGFNPDAINGVRCLFGSTTNEVCWFSDSAINEVRCLSNSTMNKRINSIARVRWRT